MGRLLAILLVRWLFSLFGEILAIRSVRVAKNMVWLPAGKLSGDSLLLVLWRIVMVLSFFVFYGEKARNISLKSV